MPGTGRGDKVPAMLEPGELVVPRKHVPSVLNNNYNNQPSINVSLAGAYVMDDPNQVESLWRETLRDMVREEIRVGRDTFYGE